MTRFHSNMQNKSPAFQFYPADYLADINVRLMSNQAGGCYLTLMCHAWLEGSIPSDLKKIGKLCGEDGAAMAELWLTLGKCFRPHPNDPEKLVHPRLEKERIKQNKRREERVSSGKKGANGRWGKDKKADGAAIVLPIAKNGSSSSSSSSTSSSNQNISVFFEEDWKAYPRKAGSKKKAVLCYAKSVNTPEQRKKFQAKTQAYLTSCKDPAYYKHGETWFRNWEDYVVDGYSELDQQRRKKQNDKMSGMIKAQEERYLATKSEAEIEELTRE